MSVARARRQALLVAALIAPGLGCGEPPHEELAPRQIEFRGELVVSDAAIAGSPFDATVARVLVREGQAVRAGDALVRLASAELDHDRVVARVQREWAERRTRPAPEGPAATLEEDAAAVLDRLRMHKDRYAQLYASRDVTQQELAEAEAQYRAAQSRLEGRRQSTGSLDLRLAQLELEKARAEERLVEQRFQSMTVRAPIAGVVTRLSALEGRRATARETLAEIAVTNPLLARVGVEPDVARVIKPGMAAEVRVLTASPRDFKDRVASVSSSGELGASIVVRLTNTDGSLLPGTPVMLTVKLQ